MKNYKFVNQPLQASTCRPSTVSIKGMANENWQDYGNNRRPVLTNKRLRQKGQGLIEYIILVAIIAVASIGIVRALGQVTSTQLANITLSLQGKAARKIDTGRVQESLYSKKDLSDFTRNSSRSANGN